MLVGDELGPFSFMVSREQLVRYAGASDDYNPIHYDDEFATSLGLPGVIVHGMLNMGLIAKYVMEALPDNAVLKTYQVRFKQMVQPGQPLEIRARVRQVVQSQVEFDVSLSVPNEKTAVVGRLSVQLGDV